ncbi:hypothetical protein RSAG8_06180, partial [Rhizoctonia solani AG-8 WAC10335]
MGHIGCVRVCAHAFNPTAGFRARTFEVCADDVQAGPAYPPVYLPPTCSFGCCGQAVCHDHSQRR